MSSLLTPDEAADFMRVHKVTIYRWVKEGKIPFIRLPSGTVRIRQADLDRWLDSRSRKARTRG